MANALWHGMVRTARTAQSGYSAIPHRKAFIATAGLVAVSCVALDMSGKSHEVLGSAMGGASDQVSGFIGRLYGIGATTATFAGYNVYDDIIMNDTVGGVTFLALGIILGHYAWQKGLKPPVAYVKECVRSMTPRAPAAIPAASKPQVTAPKSEIAFPEL